jgi:basic amino acid/polyamine antiporter, APA family
VVTSPLRRSLGLAGLSFYGIGLILGAGIYSILGAAAAIAGDALWMSFVLGSAAALLTGLSYAELATMFPEAGAEYVYARRSWPRARWLAAIVGFLFVASGAATSATVAVAFAGYASLFANLSGWLLATGLLVAATLLNLLGVRESSWVNAVFTLIEAGGLVALTIVGAREPDFGNALAASPHLGVLAGASLIFFAFLGFEDIANLAEESRDPHRDVPRAIVIAVIVSTVLYVLVALASVALLSAEQLGRSRSPLADAMRVGAPHLAGALAGVALFATANTVLVAMLAASRMLLGMARGGDAPRVLAHVLESRRTPALAIAVIFSGACLLLPLGRVEMLGSIASLTALVAFVVVNACVIRLRWTQPRAARPFKVPLSVRGMPILPALGAALALALIVRFEPMAYAVFTAVTLVGLAMTWTVRRA